MRAYDIALQRAASRGESPSVAQDPDRLLRAAGWPNTLTCPVCGKPGDTLDGMIEWDRWVCAECGEEGIRS